MVSPPIAKGQLPREKTLRWLALSAIAVLAGVLRFTHLNLLGYANHYYTATVVSMLKSWHNFIYVTAEPGGSVSVDKPPVGLWLQAIFAHFLGINSLGILLPQVLAGILSVIVLYHMVRRSFGTLAGLLAALALAITPVVVATDRNNTTDSLLILVLLLAAWAFIKATETGRLRHLLLGAALVGIGFNIKMLQAYLPLPAFYALYFLGSAQPLRRKVGKLALATVMLLTISFSWAMLVDLTPASQRPYVGSSQNNTEMSLIFGYNGIDRLLGFFGGSRDGRADGPRFGGLRGAAPNNGFFQPGRGPGPGGGLGNFGQRSILRLISGPLNKEASWLLPLALFSVLGLAVSSRLSWPIRLKHQAVVLWGGWLFTAGGFFSVAGFFHEYYLSMLAAPLAALAAIGVGQLWDLRRQRPWLSIALLLAVVGATLGYQVMIARVFTTRMAWMPWIWGLFSSGAVILIADSYRKRSWITLAGLLCVVAALLITPGIWSVLTAFNPDSNSNLPSAYSGESTRSGNQGSIQVDRSLLNYLEPRTQDMKYLVAVPSAMQGADYVIATGRPVLYLGGFNGNDQVVTPVELSQMVRQGKLRYILWANSANGMAMNSSISQWVSSNCSGVQGFYTLYECGQ